MTHATEPIFSLCHATARLPNGWRKAYEAFKTNASDWSRCEYILGIDMCDAEELKRNHPGWIVDVCGAKGIRLALNRGRNCAVDAWNACGREARGKVLITVADDLHPPPRWDEELLAAIPDLDGEFVVEVKSGTSPADDEWMRVMLHSIETRAYYERDGWFFHPDFEGMYGDCFFTELARSRGCVIDARHLTFQHRHWIGTSVPFDEIYARQNDQARYDRGLQTLGRLRQEYGL